MDQYGLENIIKMLSDDYSSAFIGFFFIFLIAGRNHATLKCKKGVTHVFRFLAFMQVCIIHDCVKTIPLILQNCIVPKSGHRFEICRKNIYHIEHVKGDLPPLPIP